MAGALEAIGRSGALRGTAKELIDAASELRKEKEKAAADKLAAEAANRPVAIGAAQEQQPQGSAIDFSDASVDLSPYGADFTPPAERGPALQAQGEGEPQISEVDKSIMAEEEEKKKTPMLLEDIPQFRALDKYPSSQNIVLDFARKRGLVKNVGGFETMSAADRDQAIEDLQKSEILQSQINIAALNDNNTRKSQLEEQLIKSKKPEEMAQIQQEIQAIAEENSSLLRHIDSLAKAKAGKLPETKAPKPTHETTDIIVGGKTLRYQLNPETNRYDILVGEVAPKTGQVINIGGSKSQNKFFEELGKQTADATVKSQIDAQDSAGTINIIRDGVKQLDAGIFSGTGAKVKLAFNKFLKLGGMKLGGQTIENTETFAANAGSLVGKIIKQFGAGTGLSDADREFAMKIAGGDISLDEQSIRKLLDIGERINIAIINEHNKKAEKVMQSPQYDLPVDLKVEVPESTKQAKRLKFNPATGKIE